MQNNCTQKQDGFSLEVGANYFHVKALQKLPFNGLPGNRQSGFFVWDPKTLDNKYMWVD